MGNDRIWEILHDAIDQKRVVPIIGDEFFYAEVNNAKFNGVFF